MKVAEKEIPNKYDGHTPQGVGKRIKEYITNTTN